MYWMSELWFYDRRPINWTLGLAFTFCHFDPEQWLSSLQDWPKLWAEYLIKNNFLKNEPFYRFSFFQDAYFWLKIMIPFINILISLYMKNIITSNMCCHFHYHYIIILIIITSNMWASPPLPPWLGAQVSPYLTRMLSTSDLLLWQCLDRGIWREDAYYKRN